jgi:hypothetical protein
MDWYLKTLYWNWGQINIFCNEERFITLKQNRMCVGYRDALPNQVAKFFNNGLFD